jgi:hypothetical protein
VAAAAARERILPAAEARGRYFRPQSLDSMSRSTSTWSSARRTRSATVSGVSTSGVERSRTPSAMPLPRSGRSVAGSRCDCAVSIEIVSAGVSASSGRNE